MSGHSPEVQHPADSAKDDACPSFNTQVSGMMNINTMARKSVPYRIHGMLGEL